LWQGRASLLPSCGYIGGQYVRFLVRILTKRTLIGVRGARAPSLIGKCRAYCEPIIIPPLEEPDLSDYSLLYPMAQL
jgi:hypothetical protein